MELAFAPLTTASDLSFYSGPGWTGQVIVVAFFLMVTSAMEAVRRKYFEMFWFTHHLFVVFFGGLLMHGSFCFIKGDNKGDPCRGGIDFFIKVPHFGNGGSPQVYLIFLKESTAKYEVDKKQEFHWLFSIHQR